jgi:hypothetical protein
MICAVTQCNKTINEGIIINSPITQAMDRSTGKLVKINLMEVVCSQCFARFDLKSNNIGEIKVIS